MTLRASAKKVFITAVTALALPLFAAPAANAHQWTPHIFPSMGWCNNYIRAHNMAKTHYCAEGRAGTAELKPKFSSGFGGAGGSSRF